MGDGALVAGDVVATAVTGAGGGGGEVAGTVSATVIGAGGAGVAPVSGVGSVVAEVNAGSGSNVVAEVVVGKVGAIESGGSSAATVPIGPVFVDVVGSIVGALDSGESETMPLLPSSERATNTRASTAITRATPARRPSICGVLDCRAGSCGVAADPAGGVGGGGGAAIHR